MRRTDLSIELTNNLIGCPSLLVAACRQVLKRAKKEYLWPEFWKEAREATEFAELLDIVNDWFEVR